MNIEIDNIVRTLGIKNFRGCFMKDDMPKKLRYNESGIVNLENSDSNGSHWVAYFNDPSCRNVEYFDSFGIVPPPLIESYLKTSKKSLVYNSVQYQHIVSILCGWYCLLFINERFHGTKPYDIFYKKLSLDPLSNEQILKNYFVQKL
jgi:hypothetical protein